MNEQVTNGAQLLDERIPGWHRRINLETLNLNNGTRCICAQLSEDNHWDLVVDFLVGCDCDVNPKGWLSFVTEHGFCCDSENHDSWVEAVNTRLALDALPEPVEEPVLV